MLEREYLLNIQDLSTHFPTINMITECEWVSLVREILKRVLTKPGNTDVGRYISASHIYAESFPTASSSISVRESVSCLEIDAFHASRWTLHSKARFQEEKVHVEHICILSGCICWCNVTER